MEGLRVGLTGGIAAGKSTVASWLRQAGFRVVDADRVVAELYRPGGPGAQAVEALFGAEFLTAEGAVDHRRLAERVFADEAARRRLETAIHPLVRQRFAEIAREAGGVTILEAPLLVEGGLHQDFDLVVTVEAAAEVRLARAVARGLTEEEARARLAAQTDEATRVAAADLVLRNEGSRQDLRRQVDRLVTRLREGRTDAP